MSQELFVEPGDSPRGPRCTYLSLRRDVRALVNNRIAGGRLNVDRERTIAATQKLINGAWQGMGNLVANNEPKPGDDPNRAGELMPILRAFFPNDAPAIEIDGSTSRARVFKVGEVAYYIWQSRIDLFQEEGTKRNFSDVGRGGAGALVVTGLASSYHVDPERRPEEAGNDIAYFDRIVGEMMVGLEPGAVLQFWNINSDYEAIKNRRVPGNALPEPHDVHYGHSPIFVRYLSPTEAPPNGGIKVIDQFGRDSDCPIVMVGGGRRLSWDGTEQIWIAANWAE